MISYSRFCLRIIFLVLRSHQGLRRGFDFLSNDSIVSFIARCSCRNWFAVVFIPCCCLRSVASIASIIAVSISVLFLSYWLLLSFLSVCCFLFGGAV